jgi:hypothetical protein
VAPPQPKMVAMKGKSRPALLFSKAGRNAVKPMLVHPTDGGSGRPGGRGLARPYPSNLNRSEIPMPRMVPVSALPLSTSTVRTVLPLCPP